MVIDGKKIAAEIIADLKKFPKPKKFLAAVLIGDNSASVSFLKQKENVAKELGVDFRLYKFPEAILEEELKKKITGIAEEKLCGGIIIQLPLPPHVNRQEVLNGIPLEKDVDVLSEKAFAAFLAHKNPIVPPVVGVVEKIIKNLKIDTKSSRVAVVGAGFLVGKPISEWLQGKALEVRVFDIGSDLRGLKNVDMIISGVGKAGLITSVMLKEKVIVIDFGYSMVHGKICGDFNPGGSEILYTPTPGGTGPILVAELFENFYTLNGSRG